MPDVNIIIKDGKYACEDCGEEITEIIGTGTHTLDIAYRIDANGNMDTDYDVDWDIPAECVDYACGSCRESLGELTEDEVEAVLRHNAGLEERLDIFDGIDVVEGDGEED